MVRWNSRWQATSLPGWCTGHYRQRWSIDRHPRPFHHMVPLGLHSVLGSLCFRCHYLHLQHYQPYLWQCVWMHVELCHRLLGSSCVDIGPHLAIRLKGSIFGRWHHRGRQKLGGVGRVCQGWRLYLLMEIRQVHACLVHYSIYTHCFWHHLLHYVLNLLLFFHKEGWGRVAVGIGFAITSTIVK